MKSRNLIAMMMTLLTPMMLFAQSVTGTVTSEAGDPLPNANVVVVGTDMGTISDETGTFVLDLGAGSACNCCNCTGGGGARNPVNT